MKIQYLITSLEKGGAQAAVPRIVKVMRDNGHRVDVTACEPRGMGAAGLLEQTGCKYHLLFPERRNKVSEISAFARIVRQSRPDVIWTSLSAAGLIGAVTGALLGIPVVSWKNCANRLLHTRLIRNMSRLWLADSSSVAAFLTERIGIASERVMTWPLFEQMTFVQPTAPWQGDEPLRIGSIGRLHPQKGYDFLIEAVARLLRSHPDLDGRFHVTIVGDGPERERLERLIRRHRLRAVITLPGATDDVRPFLQSLHLYLQPSRYEGMCLAAHEAMSAGLPIIATPVGELLQSLRASGGGLLLQGDIATSLAAALEQLIRHPWQLSALGRAGRAYIEETYSKAAFDRAGRAIVNRVETIVARRSQAQLC